MNKRLDTAVILGGTAVLAAGLVLAPPPAHAATGLVDQYLPQQSVLRDATPVPDAELAHMRGRYVAGNRITSFGLVMNTCMVSCPGSAGGAAGMSAGMNVGVDFSGATPQFTVSRTGTGSDFQAGDRQFHGTFQTVQAAGDFNTGFNTLDVDIVHGNAAPSAGGSLPTAGAGLGVALKLPNGSYARQGIVPGQGLRQAIRMQGNSMVAGNHAQLRIGLSELKGLADTAGIRQALQSLHDLR